MPKSSFEPVFTLAEYTQTANDFYKEFDPFLRNESKTNHNSSFEPIR